MSKELRKDFENKIDELSNVYESAKDALQEMHIINSAELDHQAIVLKHLKTMRDIAAVALQNTINEPVSIALNETLPEIVEANKRSDLEALIYINISSRWIKDNVELNPYVEKICDDIQEQFELTYKPQ